MSVKIMKTSENSLIPCNPQSPQVSTAPLLLARDIIMQLYSGIQHINSFQHKNWGKSFFIVLT